MPRVHRQVSLASSPSAALRGADAALVIAPAARLTPRRWPKVFGTSLDEWVTRLGKEASPGDLGGTATTLTDTTPQRLTVGSLPDRGSRYNSAARAEAIRRVTASARTARGTTAVVLLLDDAEHLTAAANAVGRAFPLFSAKTGNRPAAKLKIAAVTPDGKAVRPTAHAREVLEHARQAARLVDSPPTDMNPAALAREARAMLRGVEHVRWTEIRGNKLLDRGLGGIHAVGRTARSEPRLLIASYAPPRAKGAAIALVGKGISYDTGGLHLKGRGAMEGMKGDMGGAAAVLGAFRVIAATGVRRRVHMLLCLAENAIGAAAYKPDDILTMHSGKTVEINNTDAEGRVVLADGVSWAVRKLGAEIILDAATLTGAQMVSTGSLHAAVISNDADLEAAMVAAGHRSGDLVHPMMFAPELYKQEFRSPVADMRNSVKNRSNAQVSCAAQFIYWHIEDTDARWAHVDLAGPAQRADRGTGYGVALLADAVARL